MPMYRSGLPQLSGDFFVTDGGLETTLVFHEGLELPCFAAFDLLKTEAGSETLRKYFQTYASIAEEHKLGFILESVTWRASRDWGGRLGYSDTELADMNLRAIEMLREIRDDLEKRGTTAVISGCIGPRGDGYAPDNLMTADEAEAYHSRQIGFLSETEADMVSAMTLNAVDEAVGITRAAQSAAMPVVLSFTLETDGKLPSGQPLREAIETVDDATESAPAYYMINCAHPTHFETTLIPGEPWTERIRGIRANASTRSHAELDEADELDDGNPAELGAQYASLREKFDHITVLGGCCGTDHRHIREIIRACTR